MKKTKLISVAFTLFFGIILFGTMVFAQSTDQDNPTVLKKNEIQGKNMGGNDEVFYYTFTAGPGVVKLTADLKNGNRTGRSAILYYSLLDQNFKELKRVNAIYADARNIQEIKIDKKQKVILKLEVGLNTGDFRIQLAGATNFTAESEEIEDITADSTQTPQQICMPRNGVLILTMGDGKKVKVDLSKVQKIEIQ